MYASDKLRQSRIIAQRIAMATAVIGINIRSVSTEHNEICACSPAGGNYTLLYCFFQGFWQIVPAVAIFIARVEASIGTELDSESWDVPSTDVIDWVNQPGFERGGQVLSSYNRSDTRKAIASSGTD